jgi:hypothetical protein
VLGTSVGTAAAALVAWSQSSRFELVAGLASRLFHGRLREAR